MMNCSPSVIMPTHATTSSAVSPSSSPLGDNKWMTADGRPNTDKKFVFPFRLHGMLNDIEQKAKDTHIVSWIKNGEGFKIHDNKLFASDILPRYFEHIQYKSFIRQINIYGFQRIRSSTTGASRGAYFHPLFIRDKPDLSWGMTRTKVKGNGILLRLLRDQGRNYGGSLLLSPTLLGTKDPTECISMDPSNDDYTTASSAPSSTSSLKAASPVTFDHEAACTKVAIGGSGLTDFTDQVPSLESGNKHYPDDSALHRYIDSFFH
mmetsp:Transcript_3572/g.5687  ORF Transcript_3572/g.5687 Transcript_3572/m.5687 type:complete len:263 (+) Transcript_3572:334-1122(+)